MIWVLSLFLSFPRISLLTAQGESGEDSKTPAYYRRWNNIDVIFHLAPLMSPEQHRRLCGNDIGSSNNFNIFNDELINMQVYLFITTAMMKPLSFPLVHWTWAQFPSTSICLYSSSYPRQGFFALLSRILQILDIDLVTFKDHQSEPINLARPLLRLPPRSSIAVLTR